MLKLNWIGRCNEMTDDRLAKTVSNKVHYQAKRFEQSIKGLDCKQWIVFDGIRDVFLYLVKKNVEFVKKRAESKKLENEVSDSTDVNNGVDVSFPVVRNGVEGATSEVIVVCSTSIALAKLQTKKSLINCIDKIVFDLWESRKDFLFNPASA
eukprot:Awhi_evm1s15009